MDGVKGDLNQAIVLLGLVLHIFVVCIVLGFCVVVIFVLLVRAS